MSDALVSMVSIPFGHRCRSKTYAIRPYEDRAQASMLGAGGVRPVWLSKHALARSARRNVVPDAVEYVLAYGRMVQRTGVTFFFLAKRDIPLVDRRATWAARLAGTAVLLASNGEVITIYRNQRALRAIRRKQKYRLTPEQCPAIRALEEMCCSA